RISKKILLLCGVLCGAAVTAGAQSAYSKFGYGLLRDNVTAAQSLMGGVGYAMNGNRQINVMNPASYAASDTLTFLFDMGLDFTALKSKDEGNGATSTNYGGGLDYVTMQVPIGKCMGASIGLVPYSSVGYSFGSTIDNGTTNHEGSGGINQLYLGFAGRVYKGLSLGFNLSYMFGTTINDVYVNPASDNSSSLFEQVVKVKDWHIQFGAQYNFDINRDNRLTAGLVFSPGKTLLGSAEVIKYDITAESKPTDDLIDNTSLRGRASLPATWGAGMSYRWQNRLLVEADYTYQPWSKAKVLQMKNFNTPQLADRWQLSLGGEFTPSPRGNYLQRITYRAGGFYNRDYMKVGDNNVKEYGVSVGFGLPTMASKTMVNIGFEYRHRQAYPSALLTENYFNIKLGINFNELWFFQNKIK
ncbi:MAG: hypothetical protein K2M94_03720, partial [Paramuribaculum sp.]|nr:hypothetical protein [Paramuribaculum sp.]